MNIILYTYQIFERLVDIFLPKNQKVRLLEKLGVVGLCEKIPFAENNSGAIFNYRNPLCRQAIWEIKYRANKKLIADFSFLLYEMILEELVDLTIFDNFQNILLIPIPSSKKRKLEKGFNQCVLIAHELQKIDDKRNEKTFTIIENLLVKKVDTPHQTAVRNREKRLANLDGSFEVNKKALPQNLENYSFILIDDVITTGATMTEARRALADAGAKRVIGFALAH